MMLWNLKFLFQGLSQQPLLSKNQKYKNYNISVMKMFCGEIKSIFYICKGLRFKTIWSITSNTTEFKFLKWFLGVFTSETRAGKSTENDSSNQKLFRKNVSIKITNNKVRKYTFNSKDSSDRLSATKKISNFLLIHLMIFRQLTADIFGMGRQ